MNSNTEPTELKKVLKPIHLWSIAVGLVIAGEYFGWCYGWAAAGTVGFLISTVIVALMYTTFIFSFTELTTAIPHSGGPFIYSHRALGYWMGLVAGYATLIEFLFAPPAVALALGSYVHFIFPAVSILGGSIAVFVLFTAINLLGVRHTVRIELAVTLIAVTELLVFILIVGSHFQMKNFLANAYPISLAKVFAAIPYAIWFFLAIEGVAMAAEEVANPHRDIPIGYISGLITLIVLAFAVMFAAGGVGDWQLLSQMDYPIPEAMAMALGRNHALVKLLAGIGIFGLVASLNGTLYSCSRQVFGLARAGLLPSTLAKLHSGWGCPQYAVLFCSFVGIISLASGKTSELIIISALGAMVMYTLSMVSLFVLRVREPRLARPFRAPFFPIFPAIALSLSLVSLSAMIYCNPGISLVFFLILGLFLGIGAAYNFIYAFSTQKV